jgi:mRNA interferase HigB
VRIVSRRTLRIFAASLIGRKGHEAVKSALDAWFHEVKNANWKSTAELKSFYKTASVVSSERVVFNIKGNAYRLIASIDFENGIVWIKWLGAHRDYDRVNVREVKYGR